MRNRAIHGDIVAVQLLPEKEWNSPSYVLRRKNENENSEVIENSNSVTHKTSVPTGIY